MLKACIMETSGKYLYETSSFYNAEDDLYMKKLILSQRMSFIQRKLVNLETLVTMLKYLRKQCFSITSVHNIILYIVKNRSSKRARKSLAIAITLRKM